jgi:membrane associated rhomboid family serine protease
MSAPVDPPLPRISPLLIVLLLGSILPELVMQGADWGLWGTVRWRNFVYEHFAFWRGLLLGWTPNYPAQPWVMFVSYAFLHAGMGHLLVNMITLYSVGRLLQARVGGLRLSLVYAASVLGGAVGFALISARLQPMVGASGALFGLLGAYVVWDISDTVRARPGVATVIYAALWPITFLTLLNLVMFWATGGNLAWETHLGGFLAGALAAPFLDRRPPPSTQPHPPPPAG